MTGWETNPVRYNRLTVDCSRAAFLLCLTPGFLLQRGMLAVALLAAVGLLAGCSGAPSTLAPAVAPPPTETPVPTPTATPDIAPTPTTTPVPVPTPTPTYAITPVGLVVNEPEASPGYTLLNYRNSREIYLINRAGRVVHTWELEGIKHAKLLENGNLAAVSSRLGLRIIDPESNILWSYPAKGHHHDFIVLSDGNVLMLMNERKSGSEAIAWGANPDAVSKSGLQGDYIIEVRPAGPTEGEIVWQWSVWDHLIQDFDPDKPNYGVVAEHPELIDLNYRLAEARQKHGNWTHTNTIDYDPELDQIMLSVRNLGELWIIDHSTTTEEAAGHSGGKGGRGGDLLYRWGNPAAYRAGSAADRQLYWAHHIQWIKPGLPGAGNILLFNNGAGYPGNQRYYSSIDEIALPVAGAGYRLPAGAAYPPVSPVWSYTAQPPEDWYAPRRSGVQRLPNGNTLIVDSPRGTIFEVTPAGKTVWKYINPLTADGPLRQGEPMPIATLDPDGQEVWHNILYRAYHYPPDYPGLQKLDLSPGEPIERPPAAP